MDEGTNFCGARGGEVSPKEFHKTEKFCAIIFWRGLHRFLAGGGISTNDSSISTSRLCSYGRLYV